ncbi:hypothetical protein D9M68_671260 [compost metagenome]
MRSVGSYRNCFAIDQVFIIQVIGLYKRHFCAVRRERCMQYFISIQLLYRFRFEIENIDVMQDRASVYILRTGQQQHLLFVCTKHKFIHIQCLALKSIGRFFKQCTQLFIAFHIKYRNVPVFLLYIAGAIVQYIKTRYRCSSEAAFQEDVIQGNFFLGISMGMQAPL